MCPHTFFAPKITCHTVGSSDCSVFEALRFVTHLKMCHKAEDGAFISIANFEVGFDPSAHAPLKFASGMLLRNDAAGQDKLASMLVAKTLTIKTS